MKLLNFFFAPSPGAETPSTGQYFLTCLQLQYEPRHEAGQLAVAIFNTAYVLKLDVNKVESELADFADQINALPQAKPLFVEPPEYDDPEIKTYQLKIIDDLPYTDGTKKLMSTSILKFFALLDLWDLALHHLTPIVRYTSFSHYSE